MTALRLRRRRSRFVMATVAALDLIGRIVVFVVETAILFAALGAIVFVAYVLGGG